MVWRLTFRNTSEGGPRAIMVLHRPRVFHVERDLRVADQALPSLLIIMATATIIMIILSARRQHVVRNMQRGDR